MRQMQKLKQFCLILSCIFSLLVSSPTVCVCSHHQEKVEQIETKTSSSCHQHQAETAANNDGDSDRTVGITLSDAGCFCVQPAPRVFVKTETIKPGKQIAAISPVAPLKVMVAEPTEAVEISVAKPFYLSDSFYNLSSGRAPPRL